MRVVAWAWQAEDTTSLQALVDDGADLTAVNGVGQTLYEVAQEKDKRLSLQWLDQMNAAAVRPGPNLLLLPKVACSDPCGFGRRRLTWTSTLTACGSSPTSRPTRALTPACRRRAQVGADARKYRRGHRGDIPETAQGRQGGDGDGETVEGVWERGRGEEEQRQEQRPQPQATDQVKAQVRAGRGHERDGHDARRLPREDFAQLAQQSQAQAPAGRAVDTPVCTEQRMNGAQSCIGGQRGSLSLHQLSLSFCAAASSRRFFAASRLRNVVQPMESTFMNIS